MRPLALLALCAALAACTGGAYRDTAVPITAQRDFQPDRYLGRWYEIARYPVIFEQGCTATTADYGPIDFPVFNQFLDWLQNNPPPNTTIETVGQVMHPGTPPPAPVITDQPATVTGSTTGTNNNDSARREREVSPLPTLTSTPSAAYQVRRPSASRSGSVRATSRDGRPALSPRTKTEPMASPSGTSESLGGPKRGLFRRGGSFRQAADVSSVKSARR